MDKKLKKKILEIMVTARCMEERMVKMSKTADGHFWLGGIGEEAFNVPLGLLIKKGEGPDHDYMHFHYRNGPTMIAMDWDSGKDRTGKDMLDTLEANQIRQMNNRDTDPFSRGRNFSNHYAYKKWNVVPVSSTIQTQCAIAPGTARAQKRHGGTGISIVTFGDAGTAEADFHVMLNWATQPANKAQGIDSSGLPLLMICTNNGYGISTDYKDVHGQNTIAEIVAGYGVKTEIIDGNDPIKSYETLKKAMAFVRKERKPYYIEAIVSRLRGHSSSSGANQVPIVASPDHYVSGKNELDPNLWWRDRLIAEKVIKAADYDEYYKNETARMAEILTRVKKEPEPPVSSIFDHIFA